MRWMKFIVLGVALVAVPSQAESVRILKVLPHLLDGKGRHALQPSLYERDAYQAHLRQHPELRSALRFDVHWKSSGPSELKLRIEIRGSRNGRPEQALLEKPVKKRGLFGTWSKVVLDGEAYQKLGDLTAWRATLWSGDQQVAEQRSFLW